MKKLIVGLAVSLSLLAGSAVASSNVTCQTFGNQRTCSGTVDGRYVTQTCTTFGSQTTCSSNY